MSDVEQIATTPEAVVSPTLSTLGSPGVREFARYFIASAGALLADAGSLYVLTSVLNVPYLYSGAIGFVVGIVVVYVLSVVWVFEQRSVRSRWVEFAVFALIGIVGLALNEGVLYVLTGLFGVYYLISKLASIVFVFAWNFFARKYMLFRP